MKKIFLIIILLIIFFINSVFATQTYLNESEQWQNNLTKSFWNSLAFADIDNDGDLDLALSGCTSTTGGTTCSSYTSKIYLNNGSTLIESQQWQQNLTPLNYGSLAFADIDNDGDLDLALSGCNNGGGRLSSCSSGGYNAKVYINNGTSLVESSSWQGNLTGNWKGSLVFVDVDNDGRLDLVMIGSSATGSFAKVYINNGSVFTESSAWQQTLVATYGGSIAFGDINNDGNLDLGLIGDSSFGFISRIYTNNRSSLVKNSTWQQNLLGMELSDIVLGDIDNDGDLDLSLTGHTSSDLHRIYRNNGTTFIGIQQEDQDLGGYYEGSQALGDYDNDGDLDLITTGKEGYTFLYLYNTSSDNFTKYVQDPESHIVDIEDGSNAIWADLDNDADLDLIAVGFGGQTDNKEAKIYISNASLTKNNTQPLSPNSSFSANYVNNILTLSWSNGSDTETNTSGLYYNLKVGNVTNNNSIISGVYGGSSNPTAGYFGNMMQRKSISLNVQLEANKTYYWAVQTIDTGLAKSNWSIMQNFTTSLDVTKPNVTINEPSPNASLHTTNPYFIFNVTATDVNSTNVTLYANFNGTMLANETNSSGINGTYVFIRNLTNYNDNVYSWYIEACDSVGNCQTSGRSFYLDRAYPLVYLISPANSASWTSSSAVTFSYNVSDVDIANCSLSINNAVVNTSTSVNEDTQQNFTYSLSNGNYNWNVNCTDYVGYTNSSSVYSLTVNYVAPTSVSGGGGGTASATPKTYVATAEQLLQGYTKELSKSDKIKFLINNKNHSLLVNSVNETLSYANLTLNSTPLNFIIYINATRKFKLTNDNYYDLSVRLNNITENKANLTIKQIYEKIEAGKEEEKEGKGKEVGEEEKRKEEKLSEVKRCLFFWVIGLIVIIVILVAYLKKYTKYRRWKKWTLLG